MNERAAHPDQAAVDWLLTLCDRGADPRTVDEWADWMEQDPAHARAFERIRMLWEVSAQVDWADVEAARARARRRRLPRPGRRYPWLGAAAACCALFALVAVLWLPRSQPAPAAEAVLARFETGIGEVREATLDDGSAILLGAASRVEAEFGPDLRRLRLLEGSAEFNVAPDPERPFVVEARYLQARALGTRFRVHQRTDRTVVEVAGGRVRVSRLAAGGGAVEEVELGAGEAAAAHRDALQVVPGAGSTDSRPWNGTEMLYRNEPLSNLVADLNRHVAPPLRLSPEVDAGMPVSGRWRLDAGGRRIPELLGAVGLRLEPRGDVVLLHPRPGPDDVD